MASWKKVLREDLAVGAGLITYEASSADANTLALTLADNGSHTDVITLTLGDNLSVASVSAGAATLNVTGLATVATTGSYTDLTNTPTIPTVGNGAITFTGDSYITPANSFTLNQAGNQAITFAHATYSNTATTDTASPAFGGTFNVVSSVTYNAGGHVTAANVQTITLPTPDAAFVSSVSDTAGQTGIDLTVSNGVLSAVASGLTTTSNVTFNNLVVSGNLTVNGTTTQLDVTNLNVEDKIIKLADTTSPTNITGDLSGIQVETSATEAGFPELLWSKDAALSGWTVSNHHATANIDVPIAVMKQGSAVASAGEAYGGGSFFYDTSTNILYVDIS